MRKQNGFKAESTNFINKLIIRAKAEEVTPPVTEPVTPPVENNTPPTTEPVAPTVNYEDLLAMTRKQEKDKLYPQIKKLEKENKELVEKNNANLLAIGQKESEIATLNKTIEDLKANSNKSASETEKELQKTIDNLTKEINDLKNNTVSREDIEKEIREEYEVKLYREQKLRELGESVIPELVVGTTKEDIDKSLEASQEQYKKIQERILSSLGTTVPVVNTNVSSFQNANVSLEDIAKLDPRSPEYAQLRAKLGVR